MQMPLTNEEFLIKLNEAHPNNEYTPLEEYKGMKIKIRMRHNCKNCNNYEWDVAPNNFIFKKTKCPACYGNKHKDTNIFKQELFALVGNEYSVLGEYKNSNTKIKVRHNCSKCKNYEYSTTPSVLLQGYGCPKCSGSLKKTQKEFEQNVFDLFGKEYTVLGTYKNNRTKIKIKHNCAKCNNHEWDTAPSNFLKGHGCPKCAVRNKKTTEEFKQEVFELVGDEYSVVGEYKAARFKIRIRHNCAECNNHEWEITPNGFLEGHRCPVCLGNIRKTPTEFSQEMFYLYGNEYTILGTYENCYTKILVRHNCKNCNNYEWEAIPNTLRRGFGCPKCSGNLKKTTEEFKQEVFDLVGDEYLVLGEYVNAKTKIKIKHNCQTCNNYEYEVSPNKFFQGRRCPKCNESKGVKQIIKFLKQRDIEFKIEYKFKDCKYKAYLPFDIAILKDNKVIGLIEYDGKQHFKAIKYFGGKENFNLTKLRDSIKTKYCEENNIPLLRIKYTQFDDIELILNHFLENPSNYIKNHWYGMTKEEYYKELKAS